MARMTRDTFARRLSDEELERRLADGRRDAAMLRAIVSLPLDMAWAILPAAAVAMVGKPKHIALPLAASWVVWRLSRM